MPYNLITGWFENPVREQRRHAAALRKQGHWNYLRHKPLVEWTPEELAEMFARYIGWSPEEILALSADEMIALVDILYQDPRDLSPLQMHHRYVRADSASPAVGEIVRLHDERRIRENREMFL
jgi:hypothetical protein